MQAEADIEPGFTVIDAIVVTALLAGTVCTLGPEFARAGVAARQTAVENDLAVFRRQIAQFRTDHHGHWPAEGSSSSDLFVRQMTGRTDAEGLPDERGTSGPYILGSLPVNPWTGSSRVLVVTRESPAEDARPSGSFGWVYNSSNGRIGPWRDEGR